MLSIDEKEKLLNYMKNINMFIFSLGKFYIKQLFHRIYSNWQYLLLVYL